MKRNFKLVPLLFSLLIFCSQAFGQATASATTAVLSADDIVRKHLDALGGVDKIKALQSVRMTGKALLQGGALEAPITIQIKRPSMMHLEMSIQGKSLVQAYDGASAWEINPFTGSSDPQKASEEASKEAADDADLEGALVDYKTKGNTVELVGKEDFEGSSVYKLKVTKKGGDIEYLFLDAQNFLPLKQTSKRKIQGTEVEIESILGDYKAVNGVLMPFSMEQKIGGRTAFQLSLDKIEANVAMDSAIFKMPAAKTEAKDPAKKP